MDLMSSDVDINALRAAWDGLCHRKRALEQGLLSVIDDLQIENAKLKLTNAALEAQVFKLHLEIHRLKNGFEVIDEHSNELVRHPTSEGSDHGEGVNHP
jgi:cell division protein FtsB